MTQYHKMITSPELILSLPEIADTSAQTQHSQFHWNQTRGSQCHSKLHTCAQIKISPLNTTNPVSALPKPSTGSYSWLCRASWRGTGRVYQVEAGRQLWKDWRPPLGSYRAPPTVRDQWLSSSPSILPSLLGSLDHIYLKRWSSLKDRYEKDQSLKKL